MATTPKNMQTIENAVYSAISACLDVAAKETIEFSPEYYTFHLPNGVQKMDFPKNTYIDVCYRINYGSLLRIRETFDKIQPQKLLIVAFGEDDGFIPQYSRFYPGRDISVVSFRELKIQIETILSKDLPSFHDNKGNDLVLNENNIPKTLKKTLQQNKVSIFLGAGVSASAGIVTWNDLLEQLYRKNGIAMPDGDINPVIKGRYIIDEYKDVDNDQIKYDFYRDIQSILYANVRPSKLIKSIASLIVKNNVESVISYNFDNLVENEVKLLSKECYPVYNKDIPTNKDSVYIYHVHGYVGSKGDEFSPLVLGEQEYHKIFKESYNWGNVEQLHALNRSTCLFIGLSMNDPNLRRLIDISNENSNGKHIHYAFLRRIEYNIPFTEKIMRSFGINCVWYDNFDELPQLLDRITN